MSARTNLRHSILSITKHNKDGSFATQANRRAQLLKFAADLSAKGFYLRDVHQLKPKHIHAILNDWKNNGLQPGTIKNRMANIRWLCQKINKAGIIAMSNDDLGIENRQYVTGKDKSLILEEEKLEKITDPDVKMSLMLQRVFGLRREESIKIKIHEAVHGDLLKLKGAWCKSGRPRELKILYPEQWKMIERCKQYIGDKNRALIPDDKSYYKQMKEYENQLAAAGIHKAHGLRHLYAQKRFFDLTGFECPVKEGLSKKQMTKEQRELDRQARKIISEELGHSRSSITQIYVN